MKPVELYDILTLDDNKDYTVANMVNYNDSLYLYLIEIDKDENIVENNQKIVKRVISDGEECVEILGEDDEEIEEVANLFKDLFAEEMEDISDD